MPIDAHAIDYSRRCDIAVEIRSTPTFLIQVSGVNATDLRNMGEGCARGLVVAALQRRGIPASSLIACGAPMPVKWTPRSEPRG